MRLSLLVFTDLDGTLLDHHNYSAEPALPLLRKLDELDIPWIINTSKTASELLEVRQRLHNRHPFIAENGAAVFIPQGYFPQAEMLNEAQPWQDYQCWAFGPPRAALREAVAALRERYRFHAVGDMTLDDMCRYTELSADAARRAMDRQFTEPLIWNDSDAALDDIRHELAEQGLQVVRGGRFVHVMGRFDKGQAMTWLAARYAYHWQDRPYVVALGDSDNDRPMLAAADHAVVVRSPVHAPLQMPGHRHVLTTDLTGPSGWAVAITALLTRHGVDVVGA